MFAAGRQVRKVAVRSLCFRVVGQRHMGREASLEIRLLGQPEVVDDGRAIDLGARKQRALLCLLVLHANRVVTTDRLLEELWGNDAAGKENALWVRDLPAALGAGARSGSRARQRCDPDTRSRLHAERRAATTAWRT